MTDRRILNDFKVCTRCDEAKRLKEFSPNPNVCDGRASWCRECHNAYVRDQRARGRFDTKKQQNAYRRAEARVREAHRAEFDRYYAEELAQ